MGDSRIGKCCCNPLPEAITSGIWAYSGSPPRANAILLVTETYSKGWVTDISSFSGYDYRSTIAEDSSHVVNGSGNLGDFDIGVWTVDTSGDNFIWNGLAIFNIMSITASGINPTASGALLFRIYVASNTGAATSFLYDYNTGFTPRLVSYGATNEWLPAPDYLHTRIYEAVDFAAVRSGESSPYYTGLKTYRDFDSYAAASAYLATL